MVGLKEWDVVCRALECGWQSLVLRAGGIHDANQWQERLARKMILLPNDYHEAFESVRRIPEGSDQPVVRWQIRSWAEVVEVIRVEHPWTLEKLMPYHILHAGIVEKRFNQNNPPGVWLLLLRVHRFPSPWDLKDQPEFAGCRSVVALPQPPLPLVENPVLNDTEFEQLQNNLKKALLES